MANLIALPEYRGRIADFFLLTFLRDDGNPAEVLATFDGILKKLHSNRDVNILVTFSKDIPTDFEEKFREAVTDKGMNNGRVKLQLMTMLSLCKVIQSALVELESISPQTICNENDLIPRTVFAQDPFSVLEGPGDLNSLLNPIYSYLNFANSYMGLCLADDAEPPSFMVRPTTFLFNGANTLAGENYVLIGSDSIVLNVESHGLSWEKVRDDFQGYYGVDQLVEIGGGEEEFPAFPYCSQGRFQPVYHLDMYITLCGPVENSKGEKEELVLVGELERVEGTEEVEDPLLEPLLKQIGKSLDKTAKELNGKKLGARTCRVVRVPLLLDTSTGNYFSWNNCLVENFGAEKEKILYMPDYVIEEKSEDKLKACQEKFVETVKQEGFEVVPIENDFAYYAMSMRGSLHCMVKVLRRGEYD